MNTKVAEWLREAADAAFDVAEGRPLEDGWFELFCNRAAQVEAMTCDGCRWYPKGTERCHCDSVPGVVYPGPKFGCIHWEKKPNTLHTNTTEYLRKTKCEVVSSVTAATKGEG